MIPVTMIFHCFSQQLYQRRKKYLKNIDETRRWIEITEQYMTEETESEGGEEVRQHKLLWRSEGEIMI